MESCAEAKQQQEMIRKGPWTPQEDEKLFAYVSLNGEGRWNFVPKATGLNRNGKSCRLRWVNYLRPDLKRSRISPDEELQIMELHRLWGNRWSRIAQNLPGRTDNEIKNYWRTLVKHKKLEREENKHGQGLWMNDRTRSMDAHDPCHKEYFPCLSSSSSSASSSCFCTSSSSCFCTSSSSSQNEKLLCFDLSLRISAGTTEDFITRDRETRLFAGKIRNRSETNPHDI